MEERVTHRVATRLLMQLGGLTGPRCREKTSEGLREWGFRELGEIA
jgi:hypothetical protein